MREMFAQAEQDFNTELKEKQEVLDKTNAALKESGSLLAEEKRKLEELQAKSREKEVLEQQIKNLRRSSEELKGRVSAQGLPVQPDVQIGEADKGLDFGGNLAMIALLFPGGAIDRSVPLTPEQGSFLASLERADVLAGRAKAYQQHNQVLDEEAKILKSKSTELEERYRKIVSFCTGAPVEKVDELVDSLIQAVVSEQKEMSTGADLGRVRDFLREVQA